MILPIWNSVYQQRQNQELQGLIDKIEKNTQEDISSVVIFDLDGTLFDNRPRTLHILTEIASRYEEKVPQLANVIDRHRDLGLFEYSVTNTLANLNVDDPEEVEFIKQKWQDRFFSDEYQKYDIPIPGACKYVNKIHKAGATVIYLTGRDAPRMLVGAIESLRLFGFPIGILGTMMIVKEVFEEQDEVFKRNVTQYLRRLGVVEGIFENEPANSNLLQEEFPESQSFFVLTQHREDAPPLNDGISVLKDFRITKK